MPSAICNVRKLSETFVIFPTIPPEVNTSSPTVKALFFLFFLLGANHQEVQDGKHQYEWKKTSHAIEAETGCSGLGVCVGNEHNISSLDFCLTQDSSTMRCVFMHLCGLQENITFFLAKSIEY